jgi:hypothetical protein
LSKHIGFTGRYGRYFDHIPLHFAENEQISGIYGPFCGIINKEVCACDCGTIIERLPEGFKEPET